MKLLKRSQNKECDINSNLFSAEFHMTGRSRILCHLSLPINDYLLFICSGISELLGASILTLKKY